MLKQLLIITAMMSGTISAANALDITTSVTWGTTTINEDIIIKPGGHLTVQNGTLYMGETYRIHIEDGGQFTGLYGEVTSASGLNGLSGIDGWRGFIIDRTPITAPTIFYAIYLWDFDVNNCHSAFDINTLSGGGLQSHNREIIAYNSTVENNYIHLEISNNSGSTPLSTFTNSMINFDNCVFGEAGFLSNMLMNNVSDIRFLNCSFTGSGSDPKSTYIDTYNNHKILISRCEFIGEMTNHVIIGSNCEELRVLNNTFILDDMGIPRIGIGSTDIELGAIYTNPQISGNSFRSSSPVNYDAAGIYMGGLSGSSMSGGTINNNSFSYLGYGGYFQALTNDNVIEKNNFRGCYKATYFVSENNGVEIRCNQFTVCTTDIEIGDGAILQDQSGSNSDNSNTFSSVGTGAANIINNGPVTFRYYYNSNPPAVIVGGNVARIYTTDVYECEGGSSSKSMISFDEKTDKAIRIYPNPATTTINYEVIDASIENIILMNMEGRIVAEASASNNTSMDVSELTPGIYFLVGMSNKQIIYREKVSIQ
jgi:hypothetical protein